MAASWLTRFFSSFWRLLLRLEDFFEKSLLSIGLWLAALCLPCAGSIGIAVLSVKPLTLHYRLFCVELGILAGAGPTVIILICLRFAPKRFALAAVALGSVISWMLAVCLLYVSLADD
jgi:hypothetical protein